MINTSTWRFIPVAVIVALVVIMSAGCIPTSLPFIGGGGATPVQTPISLETEAPTEEVADLPTPPPIIEEEAAPEEPVEATPLPTSTPVPLAMATPPTEEEVIPPTPEGEVTPFLAPEGEVEPVASPTPPVVALATVVPETGAEAEPPGEQPLVPNTGAELSLGRKPAAQDRGNLIRNGDFEEGFSSMGVGNHWGTFHNGAAFYGWYDDTWLPVVISGTHTQLIEIARNTENDRYAGIYQTVQTVPGATYDFSISGMVRSTEGDVVLSEYGYRIMIGFDQNGGSDWHAVDDEDWIELPWNEQLRITESETYTKEHYMTTVTAEGDSLTVFIRCWKKWANPGEGNYDVDDIRLVGTLPPASPAPAAVPATVEPTAPAAPQAAAEPTAPLPVSGAEAQKLPASSIPRWPAIVALSILLVAAVAWRTVARRRA
jgi:hypothetical protein